MPLSFVGGGHHQQNLKIAGRGESGPGVQGTCVGGAQSLSYCSRTPGLGGPTETKQAFQGRVPPFVAARPGCFSKTICKPPLLSRPRGGKTRARGERGARGRPVGYWVGYRSFFIRAVDVLQERPESSETKYTAAQIGGVREKKTGATGQGGLRRLRSAKRIVHSKEGRKKQHNLGGKPTVKKKTLLQYGFIEWAWIGREKKTEKRPGKLPAATACQSQGRVPTQKRAGWYERKTKFFPAEGLAVPPTSRSGGLLKQKHSGEKNGGAIFRPQTLHQDGSGGGGGGEKLWGGIPRTGPGNRPDNKLSARQSRRGHQRASEGQAAGDGPK